MELLVRWLLLAAAVLVASAVLPGFKVKGLWGALVAAAVFGALNWVLGWVLFVVIGIGTLGLGFVFAFVTRWLVDALVLKLTAALTSRLAIRSFGWALLGALVMSALGTLAEYALAAQITAPAGDVHL